VVLVRNDFYRDSYWKLPGGKIEQFDLDVIAAAIREVGEETGIALKRKEVALLTMQWREDQVYHPYFCVAKVTDDTLETRSAVADEDGDPMWVSVFERSEVLGAKVLERHRDLIKLGLMQ